MANVSLAGLASEAAIQYGHLFYLIRYSWPIHIFVVAHPIPSPKDSSFPGTDQVPDYVQQVRSKESLFSYFLPWFKCHPQAMPYMVTLILLEALVNIFGRGKR